ncbi:MAG: glucokinase [Nitrosomonas sp.]|nr:MAG: glucokinase [Nitrosomonas sp.]
MYKLFLCGDIGGTKTLLLLAEIDHGVFRVRCKERYENHVFASFSALLRVFLDHAGVNRLNRRLSVACFAVAGPIAGRRAELTNLPWRIDGDAIARDFAIPVVQLINDFEATALAVEILPPEDLVTLQAGQADDHAMRVVLGAGTGMGVSWLAWLNGRRYALPTEAGHIDFAPTSPVQISLLQSLQRKWGRVSIERLLSGAGLCGIFEFLQISTAMPSHFISAGFGEDGGAAVTALARQHNHPIAIEALDLFVEIYGTYAGNLALAGLCTGGVYIAGGIAPKIIDFLQAGDFMRAFLDKGRFAALMHEIPVHVIINTEAGLLGAQCEAHRLLEVSH